MKKHASELKSMWVSFHLWFADSHLLHLSVYESIVVWVCCVVWSRYCCRWHHRCAAVVVSIAAAVVVIIGICLWNTFTVAFNWVYTLHLNDSHILVSTIVRLNAINLLRMFIFFVFVSFICSFGLFLFFLISNCWLKQALCHIAWHSTKWRKKNMKDQIENV